MRTSPWRSKSRIGRLSTTTSMFEGLMSDYICLTYSTISSLMTGASSWSWGTEEEEENTFKDPGGILERESFSNSEEIPIRI